MARLAMPSVMIAIISFAVPRPALAAVLLVHFLQSRQPVATCRISVPFSLATVCTYGGMGVMRTVYAESGGKHNLSVR